MEEARAESYSLADGAAVVAVVLPLVLLAGCASAPLKPQTAADKTTPPKLGACYNLTPEDTSKASNASEPVPCSQPHTAETFAIGTLPASTGKDYDSRAHGKWVFKKCEKSFEKFLGVDESLAMRIQLSWAWFRPSERGWDNDARWYRCDLVGGPAERRAVRRTAEDGQGALPRATSRGVADLCPGADRAEVEEGPLQ